jgi:hypothetical protein
VLFDSSTWATRRHLRDRAGPIVKHSLEKIALKNQQALVGLVPLISQVC